MKTEDEALAIMFTEGLDKNALRWVREVSEINSTHIGRRKKKKETSILGFFYLEF